MKKLLSTILFIALIISSMGLFAGAAEDSALPSDELGVSGFGVFTYCDIDPSSWYYDAALFCYINNCNFYTDTYLFEADKLITRRNFVSDLARGVNADLPETSTIFFDDCKNLVNSGWAPYLEWVYTNGYMVGTGEKTFSPNDYITREQLLTVLMRVMEKKGEDVTVPDSVLDDYVDKDEISDWAVPAVKYAVANGLITSTSTVVKMASPKMLVNKAQAVKIFDTFIRELYFGDCEHDFAEPTCRNNSYCKKCYMNIELAKGHRGYGLTCATDAECIICGEMIPHYDVPHTFEKATCTSPYICIYCGATHGKALGHDFAYGECTRCGCTQ